MTDLAALKADNARRWAVAKIVPKRLTEVMAVARRLAAPNAKARYQEIAQTVWNRRDLWFVVAVIHEREASQRWDRQLGQGDPLNEVSHNKPRGRGPFSDHDGHDAFYWGAVDALKNCPPFAGAWTDWSIGGILTLWILYNGTGYEDFHHEASPYDWGATDQEQRGKYVLDGKFDPSVWDMQVGCAAMLMAMMAIDKTIYIDGKHPIDVAVHPAPTDAPPAPVEVLSIPIPPVLPPPRPRPPVSAPAPKPSWIASLIAAIVSMFKKR